jgi:hypothetical protein
VDDALMARVLKRRGWYLIPDDSYPSLQAYIDVSYEPLAAEVRVYQAEVAAAEAAHHKRRRAALKAVQADVRRRLKRRFDLVLLKRIELEARVCVRARYLNMICLSPRRERAFTKESHPGLARPKAPSLFPVYSAYLHYCAKIACFWNQCCTKRKKSIECWYDQGRRIQVHLGQC